MDNGMRVLAPKRELSPMEKVEALEKQVRALVNRANRQHELIDLLFEHEHAADGRVMLPAGSVRQKLVRLLCDKEQLSENLESVRELLKFIPKPQPETKLDVQEPGRPADAGTGPGHGPEPAPARES